VRLNLDRWIATGPPISNGMEAFLASLILDMWTTFEMLAGDLWETAVNHGPKAWCQAVLKAQGGGKQKAQQEKSIKFKDLEAHGFDLRKKMGTILRATEKAKFQSIDDIKYTYEDLNEKRLTKLFDLDQHKDIFGLASVRNLYAHKVGVVDASFLDENVERVYERFAALKTGEPFPIDGEIVVTLTDSAIRLGNRLLVAVDELLIEHQSPIPPTEESESEPAV
jgi:hypothetical protein